MLLMEIEAVKFCESTANIWHLVGQILLIFKIVIPIILIILGMFDLGKAVISSDDKAIGKSVKKLCLRLVAAVAVFFVPTFIGFVFNAINAFKDVDEKTDMKICSDCITHPNRKENIDGLSNSCKGYAENADSIDWWG